MIRLVKRWRFGRGAFLQWSAAPACRGSCRQGRQACAQPGACVSSVRPSFAWALLVVFVVCVFLARCSAG